MAENHFAINEGVNVANDVFSIIAGLAACEVDGVVSLGGNLDAGSISKTTSSKLSRSVRLVRGDDNTLRVAIIINLEFGYEIPKVCAQVQDRIKTTVENMTGLKVSEVNVRVEGVRLS